MVEVAGRSEGKKLLSTVLVWLRNNLVGDCVDSSKIFLIVANISEMNFIVFFQTDHVQGLHPPEGVGVVAESVGGQGLEKEGQGHVVERGEGHEKGEKGMEGMADTDQRLCVNSFHVNMYFTYTLQNIFVINQMCSFSLSNKISNYHYFCFTFFLFYLYRYIVHQFF